MGLDATSLDVTFSEAVIGADLTGNYSLVRAGADGILGSMDDVVISIDSASYNSGTDTTTLSFAALVEDIYRLTVQDAITDGSSNALDGDDDGFAGGDFSCDFVVGAMSTALTSPGGYEFDPESSGYGAGQLVEGGNGEFDGLNRLQVGGEDYAPGVNNVSIELTVQEATSYSTQILLSGSDTYDDTVMVHSLTVAESGVYQVSGFRDFNVLTSNQGQVGGYFLLNSSNHRIGSVYQSIPKDFIYADIQVIPEVLLELEAGDTIEFWARSEWGTAVEFNPNGSSTPNQSLVLTKINEITIQHLFDDEGQSLITNTQTMSNLDVHREVTVPNTGSQDFARTVDVFHNLTESAITETVTIVGNLGSDGETVVFNTSDGDTIIEPTDLWIGTDDADSTGTPAIIHYIHGPQGLIPLTVELVGDNIVWTYEITVDPGETVRLAHFTILDESRAGAEAAADALVCSTSFTGEAASFLTSEELDSLANFQFYSVPTDPPTVVYVDSNFINPVLGEDPDGVAGPATQFGLDAFATLQEAIDAVAENGTIQIALGSYLGIDEMTETTVDYTLVRAGTDGLLGTMDDIDLNDSVTSFDSETNVLTLDVAALPEDVYRISAQETLGGDVTLDFVAGVMATEFTSPGGYEFDPETIGYGAGQLVEGANGEFDGLNRLQVGGEDFNPTEHAGPTVEVETLRVTTTVQNTGSSEFIDIPELSKTVTLTEETLFNLRATVTTNTNSDVTRLMRILIDGNPLDEKYWIYSEGEGLVPLSREENVLLSAGVHTIQVQVKVAGGGVQAYNDGSKLEIMQYPLAAPLIEDEGQTLITGSQTLSNLDVHREVTVPNTGSQDFARTVDVFHNSTESAITETVTIVGNLGSGGETVVFNTSDGDTIIEPTDLWIGTDDADSTGTPAIIHYIHGPQGLIPLTVELVGDNIVWTYEITVDPGETVRLAHFTILDESRADAEAAADALVASTSFTGEAASFLTSEELDSLLNFQFDSVPTDPPSVVYVNSNFSYPVPGQDPDGAGRPATEFGVDAFATIQEAIDAVDDGGTFSIAAGTYLGHVDATSKAVVLVPGNSPGQVIINGNLTLDSNDTLEMEINGASPGSGYDQLIVNGTLNLNGAGLSLLDGFDPASNTELVLIENDGTDPVSGTFNGLPEGFEFVDFLGGAGQNSYLTYMGGDGNDVVISVTSLETVALRMVENRTATDANGVAVSLPTGQDWLAEWDSYWVEIWVSTENLDSEGIAAVSLTVAYQTAWTSATGIEYGAAFSLNQTGTINDATGMVENIAASTATNGLGINEPLLFARIRFEALAEDQVTPVHESQRIGPHELTLDVQTAQLILGNETVVQAPILDSLGTEIWANPYDLNGDDQISFRDLVNFASVYGLETSEAEQEFAWLADFNQDGRISFRDLVLFATNYGKRKGGPSPVVYPDNYPSAWNPLLEAAFLPEVVTTKPKLTTSKAEQTLEAAVQSITPHLSAAEQQQLEGVQVEVVDLDGKTLGQAVGKTIYLDVNAAGFGWFIDATPLEHSEFQAENDLSLIALPESEAYGLIDLWTVIQHELAHILGHEHADEGLLEPTLDPGVRKRADWSSESDDFFASLESETDLLSF